VATEKGPVLIRDFSTFASAVTFYHNFAGIIGIVFQMEIAIPRVDALRDNDIAHDGLLEVFCIPVDHNAVIHYYATGHLAEHEIGRIQLLYVMCITLSILLNPTTGK
jgi:hypothetical protein